MDSKGQHRRGKLTRHIQYGERPAVTREAKLGRLRDRAPELGKSRKSTSMAIMGSLVTGLVVAGLYFTFQIIDRVSQNTERQENQIEVDSAPKIKTSEREALIDRIDQNEAEAEAKLKALIEQMESDWESGEL